MSVTNTSLSYIGCPGTQAVLNYAKEAKVFYLCVSIVSVLSTLAICVGNSIFVAAMIWHGRKLVLPQKLLLTLAVTDLAQGLVSWPLITTYQFTRLLGNLNCRIRKFTHTAGHDFVMMTIFAIFTIALEQFIAVAYPFIHGRFVSTRKAATFFISLSVSHAIVNYIVTFHLAGKSIMLAYKLSIVIMILGMALTIAILQVRLATVASTKARAMSNASTKMSLAWNCRLKAARVTFLILIGFLVAHVPYTIYAIHLFFVKEGTLFTRTYILPWVEILAQSNSAVNPVVYYWRLRFVRTVTKSLFRKCMGASRDNELRGRTSTTLRLSSMTARSRASTYYNSGLKPQEKT